MAMPRAQEPKKKFTFPSAFTILFILLDPDRPRHLDRPGGIVRL